MLTQNASSAATRWHLRSLSRIRSTTELRAPIARLPPAVTNWEWAVAVARRAGNFNETINDWHARRRRAHESLFSPVMKAFEESSQTVLYQLSVADVLKVAETTEHALGDLSKAETERPENRFAADVTPAYPVILLLHDLMESLGRVPSWSDFERYLFDHQDMCLRFFMEAGGIPSLQSLPKMWAGTKMRAVRWRMANFYYSFLKEVHIIVSLRRLHGLDALYHPLLDVEWKADFVCGDIRVELYFSNAKYKAATSGRKTACQKLNPGLPVIPKLVERTDRFGECWLYKDEVIAELARDIRKLGGPSIPSFILRG